MGTSPASDWAGHPGLPALRQAIADWPDGILGVAFSGGADSTALLLAMHHLQPGRVMALHVNHGLQAAADGFEQHVLSFCRVHAIPLQVQRVAPRLGRGVSVEASARDARYVALADMARHGGLSSVWLGQHQQDQVETLLLALTRGAGLPGLAGMPERMERHGVVFVRPWLGVSGQALRAWLEAQPTAPVDDPTNQDPRYTRNRIRHRLLPVLQDTFPAYADTFARSARHIAQAQCLLEEVARSDMALVGNPPEIRRLQTLTLARQANLLRAWLREVGARQASDAQLRQLQRQLAACTTRGHRIHLKVGEGFVRRTGEVLVFERASTSNL